MSKGGEIVVRMIQHFQKAMQVGMVKIGVLAWVQGPKKYPWLGVGNVDSFNALS